MSSIVNAIRNVTSDRYWLIKIFCLAFPLYLILTTPTFSANYFSMDNIIIYCGFLAVLCGCGCFIVSRNVNNISPILPSLFTLPELILKTIVSTILTAPAVVLLVYCILQVPEKFPFEWYVQAIVYFILGALFASFIFIPTVYYSVKGKISDAFKLGEIFNSAGNFVVSLISFAIQYAFTIGLAWYLFYMMFSSMLTNQSFIHGVHSLFSVLSFFVLYSYISDEYGNSIAEIYSTGDDFHI